jgi:hypothetical protein
MTFKAVVSETAKHKTIILVEAEDQNQARLKAKLGDGEVIHDEVVEWINDPEVLSCFAQQPKTSAKVYVYEENGTASSSTLTWKDGDHERCIRTEYPMHITLVKQLLEEAGYKEVSLQDWDQK